MSRERETDEESLEPEPFVVHEWLRLGTFHLEFRGCIRNPECPDRKLLKGWSPHRELLLGNVK